MYTRENYALSKAEIEKRRLDAIATAEERNAMLQLESSEIREIDKELTGTGLLLFKTACTGGDIEAIRKRNTELNAKRRQVLVKLGYPEDYTDVHYTCKTCSDTGFVGTKMCSCLKQLLITKNIQSSGMGNLIDKQSFENFSLDVFNSNPEVKARMERNLKIAKAFADNFANHHSNLLSVLPVRVRLTSPPLLQKQSSLRALTSFTIARRISSTILRPTSSRAVTTVRNPFRKSTSSASFSSSTISAQNSSLSSPYLPFITSSTPDRTRACQPSSPPTSLQASSPASTRDASTQESSALTTPY